MRKAIPLVICGPLIAIATLAAPGGSASAACTVTSSLRQTSADQVSDSVRCLQQTLNDHGFNSGPVDGWFGPVTHAAVVAYQQTNGLTVDGWVGRQTRGSLGITANFSSGGGQQQAAPRQQTQQSQPRQQQQSSGGGSSSGYGKWDPIIACESGGQWNYNGSSGYDGALQFAPSTWDAMGGDEFADHAYQATPAQQIEIAERTLDASGWGAWPTCARKAGYR